LKIRHDQIKLRIDGSRLIVEDVVQVARDGARVELSEEALRKLKNSRGVVEKLIAKGERIYGVFIGIGEL
jgi:histidine ammonia-lyase